MRIEQVSYPQIEIQYLLYEPNFSAYQPHSRSTAPAARRSGGAPCAAGAMVPQLEVQESRANRDPTAGKTAAAGKSTEQASANFFTQFGQPLSGAGENRQEWQMERRALCAGCL